MVSPGLCNTCQTPLPEGAPGDRCPKCLLEFVLDERLGRPTASGDNGGAPASNGHRFGDYELLGEIARGGMGVVFKARQLGLNRLVALKLILSGQFASTQEIRRFRSEAKAAANLHHPNIVPIYETGEYDGRHYFSMEYIRGRDLAAVVRDGPVLPDRAARYVQVIAQAIQYAHEQGTLHRDLKPSNVLIDAKDQPRITDFGLAKRLRGDFGVTVTGQMLGSPNFMPPEQTSGKRNQAGPASDVYGIGAVLYHLLTGRPPFQAATFEDLLRELHESEPVSPRLFNARVPRDLETICLKCLEKEPARRYGTAQALADELDRFLRKEPIQARPLGTPERVWRWCRRKPLVAGLLAALMVAIGIGAGATVWQWRRVAESARQLRARVYASELDIAKHALAEKNLGRALELVRAQIPKPGETDLRGFEWRYLWSQCQDEAYASIEAHDAELHMLALSPDGRFLATSADDHSVKLWELYPLAGAANEYGLRFKTKLHTFTRKGFYYVGVGLSRDGKLVAAADGQNLRLWELPAGRLLPDLEDAWLTCFRGNSLPEFLPRTPALSIQCSEGIRIWNLDTRQSHLLSVPDVEGSLWSPDERWLAVVQFQKPNRIIRLLDPDGQPLGQLEGQLPNGFVTLAVSPDSRLIACGDGAGYIHLWDRPSGSLLTNFQAHSCWSEVAFSPDSRLMASGSSGDQCIRLWSVPDCRLGGELYGHAAGVRGLAFTPDGQTLISAGRDHTVKLWHPRVERAGEFVAAADSFIGFTPDSKSGVTLNMDATVKLWDLQTRRPTTLGRFATNKSATSGAVSADGSWLAIGYEDGTIELRDLADGQLRHTLKAGTAAVDKLRISADGTRLAAILDPCPGGEFVVWDLTRRERLRRVSEYVSGSATSIAFAHRRPLLAIGRHDDYAITLWDLEQNREVRHLPGHTWVVNTVTFSPDDKLLSSSSWDGSIRVWDVATGQNNKGSINGHGISAGGGEFSPDGQTLAIVIKNGVTLWHLPAQQEMITLDLRVKGGGDLHFSPDGNTLATGSIMWGGDLLKIEGGVQFWRAPALPEIDARCSQTSRPAP